MPSIRPAPARTAFDRMVAHERLELLPNKDYWDPKRVAKHDRLVLLPMPEAATRTAALLTGQVNFVEAPSPDAIPRLKSAGMQIVTNTYPHNWPYILNFVHGPMTDIRVRRAANYALNRGEFVELLGGTGDRGLRHHAADHALLRQPGAATSTTRRRPRSC